MTGIRMAKRWLPQRVGGIGQYWRLVVTGAGLTALVFAPAVSNPQPAGAMGPGSCDKQAATASALYMGSERVCPCPPDSSYFPYEAGELHPFGRLGWVMRADIA